MKKRRPVPIIFFFARRVLEWGADKPLIGGFFTWCLKKGHSGGQKLEKAAGDKGVFWALLLFVGIPLPGTGAWTGSLVASLLEVDLKKSVPAILLGLCIPRRLQRLQPCDAAAQLLLRHTGPGGQLLRRCEDQLPLRKLLRCLLSGGRTHPPLKRHIETS